MGKAGSRARPKRRGPAVRVVRRRPVWSRALAHLKTVLAFAFWVMLVRVHALLFVSWPADYRYGLVMSASLAVIAVLVVFAYPPVTPAWRTIVLAMVVSAAVGALVFRMAPGTQAGLYAAFAAGIGTLAARCNGNARRLWTALRARRPRRQRSLRPRSLRLGRNASGST